MTKQTVVDLRVGQVWRAKRDRRRTVTIAWLNPGGEHGPASAGVLRNTSRRTQAISEPTLRRDYLLDEQP